MKKILLLSAFLVASQFSSAQVLFFDDFNDQNVDDWTRIDADGDGNDWADIFQVTSSPGVPVSPISLISRSWQNNVALTPDNWIISPAIDLTAATGTINLTWLVQAAAASWNEENYSVYVSTGNTIADMLASSVTFTEVYPGDNTGPQLSRTLDMSSFAGQTVHLAFRHHNVTDMDWISIDDVTVTQTLSTDSFMKQNFAMYPSPATSVLNLDSKNGTAITNASITDLNGRIVKNVNFNDLTEVEMSIGDLTAGMYFITVESAEGKGTAKFIKK